MECVGGKREEGKPQLGKKEVIWFTWAAWAAQMRNMHGGKAMEAWTSDSATEHIPILEEKANYEKKIRFFQKLPAPLPV